MVGGYPKRINILKVIFLNQSKLAIKDFTNHNTLKDVFIILKIEKILLLILADIVVFGVFI